MSNFFIGSLDLTKIDKSLIKKVRMRDGSDHMFLNISISKRKAPSQFGDTHFISIAPKGTPVGERNKFIIGDLREWQDATPDRPDAKQIEASPALTDEEKSDLPF